MCFRFRSFPFRSAFFRPLLFRFRLLGLCFFLSSFFPLPPHSGFFRCSLSALASWVFSVLSDLVSRVFFPGSSYSAFLFVSFRPSLPRSHSCSSGAYLVLSLSVFPLPIRFLSSASLPVPATWPLFLPFLFLPASASQWLLSVLPFCSRFLGFLRSF